MYARAVRNDAGANGILEFGDGTSAEFVSLRTLSAGRLSLLVRDSGVPTVDINGSNNVFGVGDDVKVAAAIAADDFIYYVDGSSNGTDNSGTLPTVTTLFIGSTNISSALNGIIKEIGIWPEDVGDANLQAMTS
jgi:hypothetical protein